MRLNIGTPNNHHFPFGTNVKMVLGVPILKHFRVVSDQIAGICSLNRPFFGSFHQQFEASEDSQNWSAIYTSYTVLLSLVVPGINPSGGGNLFNPKQSLVAHSLPLSPSHFPFMPEILFKRT